MTAGTRALLWLSCVALVAAVGGCTSGTAAPDVRGADTRGDSAADAPADGGDARADLPGDAGLDGDASSIGCSIASQPMGAGAQYSVTVSVHGVSAGDVTLERNPGGSAGTLPIVNGVAAFGAVDLQPGTVTLTATVTDASKAVVTRCQSTLSISTSMPPCVIRFQPPPRTFGGKTIISVGATTLTVQTVSNAQIELLLDGASQGVKNTTSGQASWTITPAPGELTIEAVCTAALGGMGQSTLAVVVE